MFKWDSKKGFYVNYDKLLAVIIYMLAIICSKTVYSDACKVGQFYFRHPVIYDSSLKHAYSMGKTFLNAIIIFKVHLFLS